MSGLSEHEKVVAWQAWCDNYNEYSNATGLYAAVEAVLALRCPGPLSEAWRNIQAAQRTSEPAQDPYGADAMVNGCKMEPTTSSFSHGHVMVTVDAGSDERLCNIPGCNYREGASPYWKPAPAAPGDVVERMLKAMFGEAVGYTCDHWTQRMTAALVVARKGYYSAEQISKAINDEGERISWQGFGAETTFAVAVLARLATKKERP